MNKLSAFGLTILLVGVICLVLGSYNLSNVKVVELARIESEWFAAVNLTHGNTYGIDMQGSEEWGKFFANLTFTQAMPLNITIISPQGGTTHLQAYFYGIDPDNRYLTVAPAIVNVTYQDIDHTGLAVDHSVPLIRFMAKQDGCYNATVQPGGFYGSKQPPDYITFLEEIVANRETYSLVAMSGGILCAVGGVVSVIGPFRNRNVKRKGRK